MVLRRLRHVSKTSDVLLLKIAPPVTAQSRVLKNDVRSGLSRRTVFTGVSNKPNVLPLCRVIQHSGVNQPTDLESALPGTLSGCTFIMGVHRPVAGLSQGLKNNLRPRLSKRTLFTGVSPVVLVPSVFVCLLLAHWAHKCLLMIIFQNKIIYMPSLPPGSRREKLKDYSRACGFVEWTERKIKSLDGTRLSLAVARVRDGREAKAGLQRSVRRVIVYFQGNGASLPPRTPMLSNVLRSIAADSSDEWILVGLSYRGYWTSSGRAHQRGIEKDAQAVLQWVVETYSSPETNLDLILWGQSIGSGVAAYAASKYVETQNTTQSIAQPRVSRLILETPFVSIKSMLAALYPDWWVPYRHLWPFLRSWWDSEDALRKIASTDNPPKILMVVATRDEIVPAVQADQLQQLCRDLEMDVTRTDVLGALHTQASTLEVGKKAIVGFLRSTCEV